MKLNMIWAYMEKAHDAAGGPFCGVRQFYTVLSLLQFLSVFTQYCPSPPQKLDFCGWSDHRAFSMYRYEHRAQKNFILKKSAKFSFNLSMKKGENPERLHFHFHFQFHFHFHFHFHLLHELWRYINHIAMFKV